MKKYLSLLLVFIFIAMTAAAGEGASGAPDQAKSLKLADLSGEELDLGALAWESSEPLLLFFWTSWCPFCVKELKGLDRRSEELAGKVRLIAVNAGESKSIVERVTAKNQLSVRMLLDEKMKAVDAYDVVGVPTFVLLKRGQVLFRDNFYPEDEINQLAE